MTELSKLIVSYSDPPDRAPGEEERDTIVVPSLAGLREAASRARHELLWILHGDARPLDGALEALVSAGVEPAVSMPVDATGAAIEPLLGRFDDRVGDEAFLSAVRLRQVPLRHTRVVSMLVRRSWVLDLEPPDPAKFGGFAATEWTARLFRVHSGTLVAASRVAMSTPGRPALVDALRMSRSGTWRRGETIRELHRAIGG